MVVVIRDKQELKEVDGVLTTAAAMANALEYYLIEGNLYRVVIVRRAHGFERVTMSMGELLTILNTLQAQRSRMTAEQNRQLDAILHTVGCVQTHFGSHFQEMMVYEIMARLNRINWFLHDCEKGKAGYVDNFPAEMRNRQRIEELVKALGREMGTDVATRIERIDKRLRQITQRADFIWPAETQSIYPEDPYWYLYSLPV
ncbi:MAG: hypothetical protein DYG89_20875 [Caldilinea sp. CFX5]|nr:hypothetical protein [Caldilinea sp. CFX5]